MKSLNLAVLGMNEMRWSGAGKREVENCVVYYSGTSHGTHRHGEGAILEGETAKRVTNFVLVSERIMLLQFNTKPVKMNIMQVYAPTGDASDEEVEEMYGIMTDILRKLPGEDISMVMGDFNAKVGKGASGRGVGLFGLGERNERGDRLSVFCEEQGLVVMNTFFKLPPRRLYTWTSPRDEAGQRTRNQIDYILINRRFRNGCVSVKTYPGAVL